MRRAVFNQKGGVGKTSITCNIAACFAKAGRKTLVVDLDSQANSTHYLLGDRAKSVPKTVADFFEGTLSFKLFTDGLRDSMYRSPYEGLYVVPADSALMELQPKLEARYKIFKLSQALDALVASEGFEEVLIDTPPALNFYSMSALMASERVLIPFDCDAFSAQAVEQVWEVVAEVAADHRPELAVEGVVINQFQSNASAPQKILEALRQKNFPILDPPISSSVVMRESHGAQVPLAFFRPSHKLTQEFAALTDKLG